MYPLLFIHYDSRSLSDGVLCGMMFITYLCGPRVQFFFSNYFGTYCRSTLVCQLLILENLKSQYLPGSNVIQLLV